MRKHPNYGLDSPRIVLTLIALGMAMAFFGHATSSVWRWVAYGIGAYFLVGASGMLFYSKVGKLGLTKGLLDRIPWRGDERVLDVGCGRGLLTVAAAHRVPNGSAVGVDVWIPTAITGNTADSVLQNARIEGVDDRVEVTRGDARELPFPDASFDVVVSNFVVHELKSRRGRERMMSEAARVLKPGGRIGLVDFIFTDDCVADLSKFGMESRRVRDGFLSFWISAILNFGAVKTYHLIGEKR
jgi:arsenite methyltransferase